MNEIIIMKSEVILEIQIKQAGIECSDELKTRLKVLEKSAFEISGHIREEIEAYYRTAGETPDTLIFGMWNIFAGIGSVRILEEKHSEFTADDAYERLIKPAGIADMDEHVIRTEGLNSAEINRIALEASKIGAASYAKSFMALSHEDKIAQINEYEKACLIFGAAYQMNGKA